METRYVFLMVFLLLLLVNGCSAADVKGNADDNSKLDPSGNGNDASSSNEKKGEAGSVANSTDVNKVKEDRDDQVNKLKKGVGIKDGVDTNDSRKESGSREADNVEKSDGDSNKKVNAEEGGDKKGNLKGKSKDELEKGGKVEDSDASRKEGTLAEECDSSKKCMDDGKKFVACLRVPGNDSPDLSLLIHNKVKGPLTVKISAPDYVQLEKTQVQLLEKEDQKVKVSVRNRGIDTLIILKAGNGNCSLDFGDLVAHSSGEQSDNFPKSIYFNFMSQKPILIFISLLVLLILASACMCLSFRWRQLSSSSSKYQRLDMELPVSGVQKSDSDTNDGWDNSWGDDWGDEEAPKTPSMPLTPSLSSKGLASRRLNKEGWKD